MLLFLKIHNFYAIITEIDENVVLINFRNDCVKIVDFLIKAYFGLVSNSVPHTVQNIFNI